MEVLVGVEPGVAEAFFCCGSLPVHTNTITHWMSGNSWRVYISLDYLIHSLLPVYKQPCFLNHFFNVFAIFLNLWMLEVSAHLF